LITAEKYLGSLEKFGINLGLERVQKILEALGNPQLDFSSIHIAGTNGKGSTAAMTASILKEAGYTVGLYTSPHLLSYTERIKVDNRDISPKEFNQGISLVKKIILKLQKKNKAFKPTVFEVLTAVAFWYFAKKEVQVAIVEVGMGGRLDATNVLYPLVSVITNVDYEHTEILGKTLTAIAQEKAAIIKPGIPVVTAEAKSDPLKVIKAQAEKNLSVLQQVKAYPIYLTNLLGEHQKINAACAVAAIKLAGIEVGQKQIECGLRDTQWPGRLQIISRKPLIIVDGAHNPAGAKGLKEALRQLFPGKFTVIFGCQATKDFCLIIKTLASIAKKFIITRSSNAQAQKQSLVLASINKFKLCYEAKNLLEALKLWDRKTPLLITGSLFLVADAICELKRMRK